MLEDQALDKAAARAREDAEVLAKGMGVHLGAPIYVTNQISASPSFQMGLANNSVVRARYGPSPQALAIEPRKVSREVTVYAVFAIE